MQHGRPLLVTVTPPFRHFHARIGYRYIHLTPTELISFYDPLQLRTILSQPTHLIIVSHLSLPVLSYSNPSHPTPSYPTLQALTYEELVYADEPVPGGVEEEEYLF